MNKYQKKSIIENAKLLAKRKKEFNPFDPMMQNTEYVLWQKTYHSEIKHTPKQWDRIRKLQTLPPIKNYPAVIV